MKKLKLWANHQSLLQVVLARISPYRVVGKGLQAIAQGCFLSSVEFCDLSSLRLFSGRMSEGFSLHGQEKISKKLSTNFQAWGMWGVGELVQETQHRAESGCYCWVLTGNLVLRELSGESLSDILGEHSSIVYRAPGKDREYFRRAPTLRSLSATGQKQGGSGAFKVCIDSRIKGVGRQLRSIQPSEAERIMGFPAGFTQFGRDVDGDKKQISATQSIKMLGNSVIPGEIARVLNGVRGLLE